MLENLINYLINIDWRVYAVLISIIAGICCASSAK